MKGFFIAVGVMFSVIIGIPVMVGLYLLSAYNGLIRGDEAVKQSYAQVQNVMQRQVELLPNLVEVVKGAANFESSTLVKITEARSKLTAVAKLDPEKLATNPELQKQLIEAQTAMTQAMSGLNIAVEAYPQLKANSAFMGLMSEVAGSQNRISVERRKNQQAVQAWNSQVRTFPRNFVANWSNAGFDVRPYFEADAAAQHAPQIKF